MGRKSRTRKDVEETVKIGAVGTAGLVGVGILGAVAGPAAAPVVGAVGLGVGVATLGSAAKTGMRATGMDKMDFSINGKKTKTKKFKW